MGRTRFMVIKLKELIKTVLFAVIGAIIIIMLIILLVPDKSDSRYNAGTYTTNVEIGEKTAAVTMTFTKNKITDVSFVPDDDMLAVFYPLAETAADSVCKQILENQSTENIALSDEYAVTGQLVADAAEACINRAKK